MALCTRPTASFSVAYEYQSIQVTLHQSDGGRPGDDQLQQRVLTRVWSEPHRGPNKLAEEGGNRNDFKGGFDVL